MKFISLIIYSNFLRNILIL